MFRHRSGKLRHRDCSQHFQTLVLNIYIIDAWKNDLVLREAACLECILVLRGTVGAQHGLHFGWNIPVNSAGTGLSFLWGRGEVRYSVTKGTAGQRDRGRWTSMSPLSDRFISPTSLMDLREPTWLLLSCLSISVQCTCEALSGPLGATEVSSAPRSPPLPALQSWLWPTRFLGSVQGAVLPPDPSWPWTVSSGAWQRCTLANRPEWAWAGSWSLARAE